MNNAPEMLRKNKSLKINLCPICKHLTASLLHVLMIKTPLKKRVSGVMFVSQHTDKKHQDSSDVRLAEQPKQKKNKTPPQVAKDRTQNQNSLLVKRQNDNTSPGDWPRKISP